MIYIRAIILIFLISSPVVKGEGREWCDALSLNPCGSVKEWQADPFLNSFPFHPKLKEIQPSILSDVKSMIVKRLEKKDSHLSLRDFLKKRNASATCLSSAVIALATQQFGHKYFECDADTQASIEAYFQHPSNEQEEQIQQDWEIVYDALRIIRPAVSEEIEAQLNQWTQELKKELLNVFKIKGVNPAILGRIRGIEIALDNCLGKNYSKIEAAGNKIYVCQGFYWQNKTPFLLIWTLAHEMGHLLDVCSLGEKKIIPYSVGSKKIEDIFSAYPLPEMYRIAMKEIVDAKDWPNSSPVCHYRNLSEAFADVVASRIAPNVIDQFQKIWIPKSADIAAVSRKGFLSIGERICQLDSDLSSHFPEHARHPFGRNRLKFLFVRDSVAKKIQCDES